MSPNNSRENDVMFDTPADVYMLRYDPRVQRDHKKLKKNELLARINPGVQHHKKLKKKDQASDLPEIEMTSMGRKTRRKTHKKSRKMRRRTSRRLRRRSRKTRRH